jgi:hypothetical protein
MNKEFIPYELALELKQLGFDEPCFAFYDESLYFPNNENQYGTFCNQKLDASSCSAPTYSQAFRWFREKHFLVAILFNDDGDIEYGNLRYNWEIRIITESFKTYDEKVANCFVGKSNYKTYEEAELASLKRLIEIANEQR